MAQDRAALTRFVRDRFAPTSFLARTAAAVGRGATAAGATVRTAVHPRTRPAWLDRWLRGLGVLAVVLLGSAVGAALAPATVATIGPLQAQLRVRPSLDPGVHLLLPPAGVVTFDTHVAPLAIEASISEVDLASARALLGSPRGLTDLQNSAPDDLRRATLVAAASTVGCASVGALTLSLLVFRRRWRRTAQSAGALSAVLVVLGGTTAVTFDSDRFAQPHFTGLLSQAPYLAGQADSLMQRLESYRTGLADIVQGVTTLYGLSGQLPVLPGGDSRDVVTVLHVSDIHLNPLAFDLIDRLVKQFKVELVIDTGDITTWGTEVESATLSRIGRVGVPYVFVRGNHDSRRTQAAVAAHRNAVVLDGDVAVVKGLVIAGIGDPTFTPDGGAGAAPKAAGPRVTPLGSSSITAVEGRLAAATLGPSAAASLTPPAAGPTTGAPPAGAPGAWPGPGAPGSPDLGEKRPADDPQIGAGRRLAEVIRAWNQKHPEQPVDIAAVHEPYAVPALLGTVPLALAGHLHKRGVEVDPSGTRVMVQGSTGGAGVSADFGAIAKGDPLPLSATLLYVARGGDRAGQVVAYDDVTVGGFGLASASLERTVVREKGSQVPRAGITPTPTPSPTPSPSPPPPGSPPGK